MFYKWLQFIEFLDSNNEFVREVARCGYNECFQLMRLSLDFLRKVEAFLIIFHPL